MPLLKFDTQVKPLMRCVQVCVAVMSFLFVSIYFSSPHKLPTTSLSILVVTIHLRNNKVWIFSHAWVFYQLGVMYNPDTFEKPGGLMVSALDYRSGGPGWSHGRGTALFS